MVRPAAHSLPHRGSPSTRVRWQPYQFAQSRSSPIAYLVTPASSASSASPSPRSLPEPDRPRHAPIPSREYKLRDLQKSKFALSLVDQAVKSLCDIWPQQDIPVVFLTSGRPVMCPAPPSDHFHVASTPRSAPRNLYLPSPVSPSTQPTPAMSPLPSYPSLPVPCAQHQQHNIAPIKGFVHEVLRRSRTSGSVLQTALCYIAAIRSKIPDLARKEKQSFASSSHAVSDDDRISKGEVGLDHDTDPDSINPSSTNTLLATVRVNDDASFSVEQPPLDSDRATTIKASNDVLPPLPPLPSPLLCPRRTFLASLILASKFMQDRCYSNRAWAKLSGLPPREIGRCERALGEALEWRLWVGKLPAAQTASGRTLTKCKSESNVLSGNHPARSPSVLEASLRTTSPPGSKVSFLKRSATLPTGNFNPESSWIGGITVASPTAYSSSPSTPGLSYSPTPTESSSGDRTIQMPAFMDVSTPPPGQFATFAGAQNDKVLAMLSVPSTGLYVSGPQDIPVSHRSDPQYFVSYGVVPSSGSWIFNDDT